MNFQVNQQADKSILHMYIQLGVISNLWEAKI